MSPRHRISFEHIGVYVASIIYGEDRGFIARKISATHSSLFPFYYTSFLHRYLQLSIVIRDDDFRVLFSDGGRLSTSELNCILSYVASSRS